MAVSAKAYPCEYKCSTRFSVVNVNKREYWICADIRYVCIVVHAARTIFWDLSDVRIHFSLGVRGQAEDFGISVGNHLVRLLYVFLSFAENLNSNRRWVQLKRSNVVQRRKWRKFNKTRWLLSNRHVPPHTRDTLALRPFSPSIPSNEYAPSTFLCISSCSRV